MTMPELPPGLHWTTRPKAVNTTSVTYGLDPDHSGYDVNLDSMKSMELLVLLAYLEENARLVREEIKQRRSARDEEK